MTPTDERDIAATLRALADGRIDTARAAASLAAVLTHAERLANAEGYHKGHEAGMLAAAAECERRSYWGTARILARMARPVVVEVRS